MKIVEVHQPPSIDELHALIGRDCGPFLEAIENKVDLLIWRGITVTKPAFFKGIIRSDRRPRDNNLAFHDMLDNRFLNLFGHPYRSNSLFVTGSMEFAATFGLPYSIFPIGYFNFVWSPVKKDVSVKVHKFFNDTMLMDRWFKEAKYQSTDLKSAIRSGHEIMLYSEQGYYALNMVKLQAEGGT